MTTFTTTNTQLESLYVGYFGRAADPAGLQYWTNQLNSGAMTLGRISASFATQSEAIAKYPYLASPTISDPTTFVNSVYNQLFGHAPDTAGLAYWVAQLNANKGSPAAVGQMILNIISGATGTDDTVVRNRVDVATDFTSQASNAGTTFNAAAQAQSSAEIATVNDTAASVTAAKAATTAYIASAPGPQLTFTLGLDALTASATNSNFNAPLIFNPGTGTQVQSLQTGDGAVDTAPYGATGNGGTLTATVQSGAAAVTTAANLTLQGIPTYTITSLNGGVAGMNVISGNASTGGISGVSTITNNGSTNGLQIGAAGNGIDLGGKAGTTTTAATLLSTVNVNNVTAAAGAATAFTTWVNTAALAGAADALAINVNGTLGTGTAVGTANVVSVKPDNAAAGVTTNGYETLTLTANAAANIALGDATTGVSSLTTLNLAGSGLITLWGETGATANHFTKVTTINATTDTGGVTVTGGIAGAGNGFLNGAVLTSFKGGSGVDSLDLSSMTALQVQAITATNLDGGSGRDTLILSGAALGAAQTTVALNTSNFEIIGVAAGTTGTYNIANYGTGIDTLALSSAAGAGQTFTLTNAPTTFTFAAANFANTAALTVAGTTGTADIFNITATDTTDASDLGALTFTAMETLNVTISAGASANGFTVGNTTVAGTGVAPVVMNIIDNDGANAVTFGTIGVGAATGTINVSGTGTGGLTTGAVTAAILNASGLNTAAVATTAGITVASSAAAITFTGSNGADTFTGSTGADTMSGGAGNDVMATVLSGNTAGGADVFTGGSGNDNFILRGSVATGVIDTIQATTARVTDMTVTTAVATTDFLTFSQTVGNYSLAGAAVGLTGGQGAINIQSVTANAAAAAIVSAANTLVKLTTVQTPTNGATTFQTMFDNALGTATITGATANNLYVFTIYDQTNSRMDIGVVNPGAANTVIAAADVVALVGTVNMSATDYITFATNNVASIAA